MITHLVGSGSLFVLQWRDFLHIGFDTPCLSHKSRNDHESKWMPLWRENFPPDRDFHNSKILCECPQPSQETVVESNENECRRRKLVRICKSTENYMQTFDVTKPFNFHRHRLVKMTLQMLTNERLRCREMFEYCLGYKFRLQSPMRYRLRRRA